MEKDRRGLGQYFWTAVIGWLLLFQVTPSGGFAAELTWAPRGSSVQDWTWKAGSPSAWKAADGANVFTDGDSVLFCSAEEHVREGRTVFVGAPVNPGSMTFSGAEPYSFDGSGITVGQVLTLGGTGIVTFSSPLTTPKTVLNSGKLAFSGDFDAGGFEAASAGTVVSAGTGKRTFTLSSPEGAELTVDCGWEKGTADGISVRKKGPGKTTLNVRKLYGALCGPDNGRIYVDQGTLTVNGYAWGSQPGEMIYEVAGGATLGSTGSHSMGGSTTGARIFLHPGATFALGAEQYVGQKDPGLWLMGSAKVFGNEVRSEGTLYIKVQGKNNDIEKLRRAYGRTLYLDVQDQGEVYLHSLEAGQTILKNGTGTAIVGAMEGRTGEKPVQVTAGILVATNSFTSLDGIPVEVSDGAAFMNATGKILWLDNAVCSTAGTGTFSGAFGSRSASQGFGGGLTVTGSFYVREGGLQADYTGLTVKGFLGVDHGWKEPFSVPPTLSLDQVSSARVTAGADDPANLSGSSFSLPLEFAAGSHALFRVMEGNAPATVSAGVTFAPDSVIHLARAESLIPGGTYPIFSGVESLPETLPLITGHLAAVESSEWVLENGVLAVKITVFASIETLRWRPEGMDTAWSGEAANWESPSGSRVAFSPGCTALFDGQGSGQGGNVTVTEGQIPGRMIVEGAHTYMLNGAKLKGTGPVSKGGTGKLIVNGDGFDNQPITVESGTLFIGPDATETAFGSSEVPLTIKKGGTLDISFPSKDNYAARYSRITHDKEILFEGNGVDGKGALMNSGLRALVPFSTLKMSGDASIDTKSRMDLRTFSLADGKRPGRATLTGPGDATLTLFSSGTGNDDYLGLIDADVSLGKILLRDHGGILIEGSTKLTLSQDIEMKDGGVLRFYYSENALGIPLNITRGECFVLGHGTPTITSTVTVAEASSLVKNGGSLTFMGPIRGLGDFFSQGGSSYFCGDVDLGQLETTGSVFLGKKDSGVDITGKKWPKKINIKNGDFSIVPIKPLLATNLTVTGGGTFFPNYSADMSTPTTLRDCRIDVAKLYISTRYGYGCLFAESNTTISVGSWIRIGGKDDSANTMDSRLEVRDGAEVVTQNLLLGRSGDSGGVRHICLINGGEMTVKNDCIVGHNALHNLLELRRGTLDARQIRPYANGTLNSLRNGNTALAVNGGTFNLGAGGFSTKVGFAHTPQAFFNGGTLVSQADWGTKKYQNLVFDPYNSLAHDTFFTLDLGSNTVNYATALQGGTPVLVKGTGNLLSNSGAQGALSGHWTVESTGDTVLAGAAGFADGLTLADGTRVSVDIGEMGSCVSLGIFYEGDNSSEAKNFINSRNAYPWFARRINKLLLEAKVPNHTVFAYQGEFLVEEEGLYTFGCFYDDRLVLWIDGEEVCRNPTKSGAGSGSRTLTKGWHPFKITARNYDGNAGVNGAWLTRGFAVGYAQGSCDGTDPSRLRAFDTDAFAMRPAPTAKFGKIGGQGVPADYAERTEFDSMRLIDSLALLHATEGETGDQLCCLTGWFRAEGDQPREWTFKGKFNNRIALYIDGVLAFKTTDYSMIGEKTLTLDPGFHSFRIITADVDNSPGRDGNSTIWFSVDGGPEQRFDEKSLLITHGPYGFIGGKLDLAGDSTLNNLAETPCPLTGTVRGTGKLSGLFSFEDATWEIACGARNRVVPTLTFENLPADALQRVGKIRVLFDERPIMTRYRLGPALGLENLTPEALGKLLHAVVPGEPEPYDGLVLGISENPETLEKELCLVNTRPQGSVVILR